MKNCSVENIKMKSEEKKKIDETAEKAIRDIRHMEGISNWDKWSPKNDERDNGTTHKQRGKNH